ncbi:hypothetical protein IAU59_005597 [Kwoniella sp. CBS 9459]
MYCRVYLVHAVEGVAISDSISNINSEVNCTARYEAGDEDEDLIVFEKKTQWSAGDIDQVETALYEHVESYTYCDEYAT